jgi:hypothetical protein
MKGEMKAICRVMECIDVADVSWLYNMVDGYLIPCKHKITAPGALQSSAAPDMKTLLTCTWALPQKVAAL